MKMIGVLVEPLNYFLALLACQSMTWRQNKETRQSPFQIRYDK